MSVVVGGTDPDTAVSRSPRRRATALLLTLAAGVVIAVVVLPPFPTADQIVSTAGFDEATVLDSGRWIPVGTSPHSPFDARRLGDRFVWIIDGGIAAIDSAGVTTTVSFAEGEEVARLTSDGATGVAHGLSDGRPALWTSSDATTWDKRLLPWSGSVQAVAIRPDGLVVLGTDSTRSREIVAHQLSQGWAVRAADLPDTGLWSTGTGVVGRGTLSDGSVGYLYSTDGMSWEDIGPHLSLHDGEVATLNYTERSPLLVLADDGTVIRPPEVPAVSLWRIGDRFWLQTPTSVWWSNDGNRWSPLPLDRAHGIQEGAPILLPFSDRALLTVGGSRGSLRNVYTWILGA